MHARPVRGRSPRIATHLGLASADFAKPDNYAKNLSMMPAGRVRLLEVGGSWRARS